MVRFFRLTGLIMAVVTVCLMCFSCGNGSTNGIFGGKSWNTVEEVRKNINGTVWTYTQPNDLWMKLEFRNGKCYVYKSIQSRGSWGEAKCEDYEICEIVKKRTSEKIVVISIGKDAYITGYSSMSNGLGGYLPYYGMRTEFSLSPKEEILYLSDGSPVSVHPTDYKW